MQPNNGKEIINYGSTMYKLMLHDSFLYNYNYKWIRHVEDIFNKLGIPILSFFKDFIILRNI